MRSNIEDSELYAIDWKSGRWSLEKKTLTGEHTVTNNGQIVHALDAGGADRTVRLPALDAKGGQVYLVLNRGIANNLDVVSANGLDVTTLLPADAAFLVSDAAGWTALRGWADLGVFTNTTNGLVPYPNSVTPGSLFLRDDGQWAQVQVTGIVDAFKYITDGTTTAVGAGPDTFRLRSSSTKVTIAVQNNDATYGDNANFSVNEAAVDHNALLNYSADRHVAHTGVTLTAGLGLSGGGDISASRSFALDLSELPVIAPVLGDYVPLYDSGTPQQVRATLASINTILDHNALLNYVADRHIAHSGVSIVAGVGISGGGDITTSRSIALDINGLTVASIATGDFIPFYSVSAAGVRKITMANLTAAIDHNSLLNYVANQHVDHTAVTLTAGAGLTGGGTIAASRTFDVGAGTGITVNANDVALDTTNSRNVDHTLLNLQIRSNISGGTTVDTGNSLSAILDAVVGSTRGMILTRQVAGWAALALGASTRVLTSDGTDAVWAVPSGGGSSYSTMPSCTRLSLVSGLPRMKTSQAGITTIYLTLYNGNRQAIYDGTDFAPVVITELSQALTDTTKSPAAAAASSNYDMLSWVDGATPRCTRSAAWTGANTRGTGAGTCELENLNGVWVNKYSVTNGPAARRGRYEGTIRTNASGTVDYIFASIGVGGVAGSFGVWNVANRDLTTTTLQDSSDFWSYAVATTWRAAAGSATAYVRLIRGLDDSNVMAEYNAGGNVGASTVMNAGVGVNSTTAFSGKTGISNSVATADIYGKYTGAPGLGLVNLYPIEYNSTTTASTWYGDLGGTNYQSSFTVEFLD